MENISYYTLTYAVSELINQIEENELIINKNEYRNFIWSTAKQEYFIDSLLKHYPIPPVYLYKEDNNYLTVIDGIQRIKTIYYYVTERSNIFVNKKSFRELSKNEQRQILISRIDVTIIENLNNSQEVLTEIFTRLNIGGMSLTRQELRNRIYFGEMVDCINELNNNVLWRTLYGSNIDKRYRDSEYILKFINLNYSARQNMSLNTSDDAYSKFLAAFRHNTDIFSFFEPLFLHSLEYIINNFGEEALRINNRFSSYMFYIFLIPLSLYLQENKSLKSIVNSYSAIKSTEFINKYKNATPKKLINIGVSLLGGCIYDL